MNHATGNEPSAPINGHAHGLTAPAGHDDLKERPDAPVILVESEDIRQACMRLLPAYVALCLEQLAIDTEWHDIAGRTVWCWPNAGENALKDAADAIEMYGGSAVAVLPPTGVEDGWNLIDAEREGWNTDLLEEHLEKNSVGDHRNWHKSRSYGQHFLKKLGVQNPDEYLDEVFGPERGDDFDNGEEHDAPHHIVVRDDTEPFRFLGHNHGIYYYLSRGAQQVTMLPISAHGKAHMIALAGIDYWQEKFPKKGKDGFAVDEAMHWMIESSHNIGVYKSGQLRGRGAWWDDGRTVMHCGDRLIVDGQETRIADFKTRFVYEAGQRLHVDMSNPLTNKEANKFVKLTERLLFEKPIQGRYLAGHCVMALIGGALAWRPHTYIVGESGSGKSWVMSNIVGAIIGEYGLNIGGDTSEAAIRQSLGGDALPVIFDDVDKDSRKGVERMNEVLGLIRVSSSDGRTRIMKGGANGQAVAYDIRSCFILASITLPVEKQADASRITVLTLERSKREPEVAKRQFTELESETLDLLTPDYVQRFQARAIKMIPIIRQNAKVFATAAAGAIGTQRLGDQYGALLAGAYSLYSDGVVSLEIAQKWVNEQDWSDSRQIVDDKDHVQCLKYIAQSLIRTDAGERQVSELVQIVAGQFSDPLHKDGRLDRDQAYNALKRYGITCMGMPDIVDIGISNSSVPLAGILRDTPYNKNWGRILKRVEGAISRGPLKNSEGRAERGTIIPLKVFLAE